MNTIGYTDDGKVFMTLSTTINGQVGEATFQLEAENALTIADNLKGAALKAQEIKGQGHA